MGQFATLWSQSVTESQIEKKTTLISENLSKLKPALGEVGCTPRTSLQVITGPTHRDKQQHNQTFRVTTSPNRHRAHQTPHRKPVLLMESFSHVLPFFLFETAHLKMETHNNMPLVVCIYTSVKSEPDSINVTSSSWLFIYILLLPSSGPYGWCSNFEMLEFSGLALLYFVHDVFCLFVCFFSGS